MKLRDRFLERLEQCRLSSVVLYELEYGAAKRADIPAFRTRVDALRKMFPAVSPFDDVSAFHAAQIRAHLEKLKPHAQPIGPYDLLLAGQALALGAAVVTNNVGEFARVPGIAVEDWRTAA